MENVNLKEQGKATKEHLEIYAKNQMQWYKFIFAEKMARFGSFIFVGFFLSLIALLFFIVLSVAFGLFLGQLMDNYSLAFLIVSVLYLLLGVILFLCRKMLFRNPLLKTLIKEL